MVEDLVTEDEPNIRTVLEAMLSLACHEVV